MVDRILLVLLVLLLPIGIIASKVISGDIVIGSQKQPVATEKIEKVIDELTRRVTATEPKGGEIETTGIVYASASAQLQIGLTLPSADKPVWVNLAGTKKTALKKDKLATKSADVIKSKEVFVYPLNGSAAAAINVSTENYTGILYVQLRQGASSLDIAYDLDKNKEIK